MPDFTPQSPEQVKELADEIRMALLAHDPHEPFIKDAVACAYILEHGHEALREELAAAEDARDLDRRGWMALYDEAMKRVAVTEDALRAAHDLAEAADFFLTAWDSDPGPVEDGVEGIDSALDKFREALSRVTEPALTPGAPDAARIAQMGERPQDKREAAGSSPAPSRVPADPGTAPGVSVGGHEEKP